MVHAGVSRRLFLFDFDGTLGRLPVDITQARLDIAAFFAARGVVATFRPVLPSIAKAALKAGGSSQAAADLQSQALQILTQAELVAAESVVAVDFAGTVLEQLFRAGWPLAVVTDNSRIAVERAWQVLRYPDVPVVIVGREDVIDAKPDPSGMAAALHRLERQLGDDVFWTGNSERDIEAAVRLQERYDVACYKVGLADDEKTALKLRAAGADRVVSDLRVLLQFV